MADLIDTQAPNADFEAGSGSCLERCGFLGMFLAVLQLIAALTGFKADQEAADKEAW